MNDELEAGVAKDEYRLLLLIAPFLVFLALYGLITSAYDHLITAGRISMTR